jgi:hypothetical protein
MPLPGRYNIVIYQGDDFDRDFLIEENIEGELVPVNFTDHTIHAFVRSHPSAPSVIGVFDILWPSNGEDDEDYSMGMFNASLKSEDTSKFPKTCVYDIQSVDNATGRKKTWVYGTIRVIREVTRG